MENQITLTQAIEGFILHCGARRLSPKTIDTYQWILEQFTTHLNADPPLAQITLNDIEQFLAAHNHLSGATLHHYHATLGSLYTWATTRKPPLVTEHLPQQIPAPQPDTPDIIPYTLDDIKQLLKYAGRTREYSRPGKRASYHTLPGAERNRAIILLLLDTGLRATELCRITIVDLDLNQQRITVTGKGRKQRTVKFSPRTGEAIWKYLTTRPNARAGDPLITTLRGSPLDKGQLYQILRRIGKRAHVPNVHPHRFRHTFATEFLRNGGDPYTLQDLLGHASMDMVRRYIHTAQIDIDRAHRRASPVDNWRL